MIGGKGQFRVRASKGVHMVVPRDRINSAHRADHRDREEPAVHHPVPVERATGSSARPTPTGTSTWPTPRRARPTSTTSSSTPTRCCEDPLTRDDVVGVYAGLRPLLAGESDSTSKLSREHAVVSARSPGWSIVAGGKYTTYRVMAKDAVDVAVHGLDRQVAGVVHRARSRWSAPTATRRCGTRRQLLAARTGLRVDRIEHLLGRYGIADPEVLDLVAERTRAAASRCRARRST